MGHLFAEGFAQSTAARRDSAYTEEAMSDSLEHQLDLALDQRRQRRLQQQAVQARTETAIHDAHERIEHRQVRFSTAVRSLIAKAVERANRHLAKRPEKCQLCEISGYYTGPLYVDGPDCNPIAYELRIDGQEVGETLIVELTHDGMIEALLGPFRPSVPGSDTTRIDLGWPPVPLDMFDATIASDLVVRYVSAIATRWPFGQKSTREGMHNTNVNPRA